MRLMLSEPLENTSKTDECTSELKTFLSLKKNVLELIKGFQENQEFTDYAPEFGKSTTDLVEQFESNEITENEKITLLTVLIAGLTVGIQFPSTQLMTLKDPANLKQTLKNYREIILKTPFKGFGKFIIGAGIGTTLMIFTAMAANDSTSEYVENNYPELSENSKKTLASVLTGLIAGIVSIVPSTYARNQLMAQGKSLTPKQAVAGTLLALIRDVFLSRFYNEPSIPQSLGYGVSTTPFNTASQYAAKTAING